MKLSFSTPTRALSASAAAGKDEMSFVNGSSSNTPIKIIKWVLHIIFMFFNLYFFFRKNQTVATPVQNSRLQKQTNSDLVVRVPSQNPLDEPSTSSDQPRVTLDSIITEYLANQHSLCKNPMANCPKFNLFVYVYCFFRPFKYFRS